MRDKTQGVLLTITFWLAVLVGVGALVKVIIDLMAMVN